VSDEQFTIQPRPSGRGLEQSTGKDQGNGSATIDPVAYGLKADGLSACWRMAARTVADVRYPVPLSLFPEGEQIGSAERML
jgi:hypothetical protein